ncbi:alpha/beta hydrolase [Pseudoalteromonas sp. B137]
MFQKIKLFKILYTLISTIATLNLLCSCTSNKYFEIQSNNIIYNGDTKFINDIPDWYRYSTNNLAKLCVSPDFTIIQKVAYVVSCNNELLHRSDVTNSQRLSAIDNYNLSVFNLLQFKLQNKAAKSLSIVLNSKNKSINLNHLTLTTNFELLNKRLSFKEFGELGVVAISEAKNRKKGFDKFYPREGIFRSVNFTFNSLVLVEKQLIVTLNYEIVSEPIYTKLGTQTYLKKYSPSAAYLALLEKADIDNFSLLGLIYATQAEFREGVFAIEPISLTKIPLIMTHGLNSDPLIWRYLTMTLLNDPDINKHFQIWHFYYPSGPPPFFTAMKLRKKVEDLLALTSSNNLVNKAVFVGHSMGGSSLMS